MINGHFSRRVEYVLNKITLSDDKNRTWFYVIGSHVYGPVSTSLFQERVKQGIIKKYTPIWTKGLAGWTFLVQILSPADEAEVFPPCSQDRFSPIASTQDSPPDWCPERFVYFAPVSARRYLLRCLCSLGTYAAFWRMECLRWYCSVEEPREDIQWRSLSSLLIAVNALAARQGQQVIDMKAYRRSFYIALALSMPLALTLIPISLFAPLIIAQAVALWPVARAVERLNQGNIFAEYQARRLSRGDGFLLVPILTTFFIIVVLIAR